MRNLWTVPLVWAVVLLAGCSRPGGDVYATQWTYGPDNFDRNDDANEPLLIDHFETQSDDNWTMTVTTEITAGTFELHMRAPKGAVVSVASADGEYRFDGAKGRWTVEILTDADARGFPEGHIAVKVVA